MSSVWGMILQWGSTIKVSIELPVATRHCRDWKIVESSVKPEQMTTRSDIHMTWAYVSWGEGQCDLYFMVEWFCLISWRLFDGLMSNILIMSHCDATFDVKINIGHSDLYFMVQWFCLISWIYLIYEGHTWDTGSVWNKNLLHKMFVGHWPIFHGPVILLNIFKIIW